MFYVASHASVNAAARNNANGAKNVPSQSVQSKFPKSDIEKLAQCGCSNDTLLETDIEQFCDRMKVFGGIKYLNALCMLKRVRYFKTARILLEQ
ncbi:unnamed protein product [Gongylonema pulchrum]|uniref:Uncharacterized protein n=1 Tax=Gongylonema pulchrum TaxID=637853 RepID=A0A3P7NSW8_9BILA|nr:unnamed protein product [Gongylonema pulchrum]